jgi:hypothetical protein
MIWSIALLFALAQALFGIRRVWSWLQYRSGNHLLASSSLFSMFLHDQPFRITVCLCLHGIVMVPLSALHLDEAGPRVSQSYGVSIAYGIGYVSI